MATQSSRGMKMDNDSDRYKIVRHFFNSGRKFTIRENQRLSFVQAHCKNPETSSKTCTSAEGRRRTRRSGPWFDGYTRQK